MQGCSVFLTIWLFRVIYQDTRWRVVSYPSAEVQSVYTAPADRATESLVWLDQRLHHGLQGHWCTLYPIGQWVVTWIRLVLWGHILPYPKDGLVQPKHSPSLARSGETTSRSLRDIWLTDCKPSTASTSFVWQYNNVYLSPVVWIVLPPVLSEDHNN